jgi:hypothetical protein
VRYWRVILFPFSRPAINAVLVYSQGRFFGKAKIQE